MIRSLFIASGLAACAGAPSHEEPQDVPAPPLGYSAVYVQLADGSEDGTEPAPANPVDGAWQRLGLEGGAEDWRSASLDWFATEFGLDVEDPELDGRMILTERVVGPAVGHRVVMSTAEVVPPEGLSVTELGLQIHIVDPMGVELGGAWEGIWTPAGTLVAIGTYVIERAEGPVEVTYASTEPGFRDPSGYVAVPLAVEHPELGPGTAFASGGVRQGDDGRIHYEHRNSFTFPY